MTEFETKCEILGDLWISYRNHEKFQEFVEYSDIALPLAYCVASKIVLPTDKAKMFVDESWEILLGAFEIEDEGFADLDELFAASDRDLS